MTITAFVGLGANLSDAVATVHHAVEAINRLPGTRVTLRSSLYRSAPVDAAGPDFINAVVGIATDLLAAELLVQLQALEHSAGRERSYRNAPRTLDLDVLLYGNQTIATPTLVVPHPRLTERAFVLVPLAEIAPALVTPAQLRHVMGQRIQRID